MSIQDAIAKIRVVAETLPEDDPDKLEMLNVEGDFSSLMEWALRKRNEWLALSEGVKTLADTYRDRAKSFESRADSLKNVMQVLMTAASEKKFTGMAATVSLKDVPPKPIVANEDEVPEGFWKVSKSIDKTAINEAVKAGQQIPGVVMDNGGVTLSIRSK